MSIDKIRRGGFSYEPEGSGRINEPEDLSDRPVEPTGKSAKPRRVRDEYIREDTQRKPDPRFKTYNRWGQLEPEEFEGGESEEDE